MTSDFPLANENDIYPYTVADKWFARGGTRYAFKGIVNWEYDDYQPGDQIVVKKFTEKHTMLVTDWNSQVKIEQKACELAEAWNRKKYVDKIFEVVKSKSAKCLRKGNSSINLDEFVRIEPWLGEHFQKWNSNNGWSLESSWASSIQAFCHWTYHHTEGELLFCDAQGIKDFRRYKITDPCIVSRTKNKYGDTDGGVLCQQAWFGRHRCNQFCKPEWKKPTKLEMSRGMAYMKISRGTTYNWDMADHTTHANRNMYGKKAENYPFVRSPTMPPPNRPPPARSSVKPPPRRDLIKPSPRNTVPNRRRVKPPPGCPPSRRATALKSCLKPKRENSGRVSKTTKFLNYKAT